MLGVRHEKEGKLRASCSACVTKKRAGCGLEALGLIEFARSPEQVQLRGEVLNRLQHIMTEVTWKRREAEAVGRLTPYGAGCILERLEVAGFEVVRKS